MSIFPHRIGKGRGNRRVGSRASEYHSSDAQTASLNLTWARSARGLVDGAVVP